MKYANPLCRLAAAIAFAVAAAGIGPAGAFGASLSADADEAPPGVAPPSASSGPMSTKSFQGTAYMKTRNTRLLEGKNYGFTRMAIQAMVDHCNAMRTSAKLEPAVPPEHVMANLDVSIQEKYFDTDKALTVFTHHTATIPDMERFTKELHAARGQGVPAAPDCKLRPLEPRTATLWREGRMYRLDYDTKKAFGSAQPRLMASKPYLNSDAFSTFPLKEHLGQSCREVSGLSALAADSRSCIWDLFPYVSYLNWPFALSGRVKFLSTFYETIEPLEADHGKPISPSVFEIPAGFTVIDRN